MSLGTLSIDIEARLAKLEQGMDKATRLIEQRNARIEKTFAGASAAAAKLVGVIGALGVTAFARDVISGVDALNDFADATGTTVENASALEDIALRTGTSIDTVTTAMIQFNKTLADAKPGSDAARLFEQLGLDAKRLREIDPAEGLLETAKALQTFADDGNKARFMMEVFKKSTRETAPFLKELAENGRLNATVTTEQAKATEDFNKQLFALQKNVTDLARGLLADALPALQKFLRELNAARETGGVMSRVFRWQREAVPGGTDTENLLAYRAELTKTEKKIRDIQQLLDNGKDNQFRRNQLADLQAALPGLKNDVAYYERLLGITSVQGGRGSIVPGGRPSIGELPDKPTKPKTSDLSTFGSGRQSLADALDRIEAADEAKLQRLREELDELIRMVTRGVEVPGSAFADVVDQLAKLSPEGRAAQKALDELNKTTEESKRIFEDTRTPAERLAQEIANIRRLQALGPANGGIDFDTAARAEFDAQARFDATLEKTKDGADKLGDAAKDLGLTFASAFEDAIVEGEKLSDVLKALEKDIVRIITRKLVTEPLADKVTGLVGGAIKAGSSGGGGGIDWGAIIGSLFEGWFAEGGYIPAGRWGMAGERGPEPVFGGRTGATVRPNSGATVNITLNGAAGSSRQSQVQQAEMIGREVMLALSRNG